ncbi:uncharacterized protein LOC123273625 [Cotesia glomerata]|uniref:uncharacterized protein LOC123273625 n=1 Tax=Cotesia glomerata TaxID=32391 RepID=UPI001D00E3E4|nr:uncharacterized protein LOC123273625 [Cotesia glomerata]
MEKYIDAKRQGYYAVFEDETWTYKKGTSKTREWQNNDSRSCSVKSNDTGGRYIICDAGGINGFIPNTSLILSTTKKPTSFDDYHGDIDSEMFHKWMIEKLLPNLPPKSMIVMDNAPYHSVQLEKQPTAKWTRDEIQVWLEKNYVDFKRDSFKAVLLELCRANKKPIKYVIDELLVKNTDHIINRLPPYHCFYNPIEMVQGLEKRHFDKNVGLGHDYSEDSMLMHWKNAVDSVTPEVWQNCVEKVEKRIFENYEREFGNKQKLPNFDEVPDDEDAEFEDSNDPDDLKLPIDADSVRRALFANGNTDSNAKPSVNNDPVTEEKKTEDPVASTMTSDENQLPLRNNLTSFNDCLSELVKRTRRNSDL